MRKKNVVHVIKFITIINYLLILKVIGTQLPEANFIKQIPLKLCQPNIHNHSQYGQQSYHLPCKVKEHKKDLIKLNFILV